MAIDQRLMLDPDVIDDPYPFYDRLREEAPVWQAGPDDIFTVTSFELLAEAARRTQDFSSVMNAFLYKNDEGILAKLPTDLGEPTLAVADPPVHTAHKQMIFPRFVSKRMALIEDELSAYARACIDRGRDMGAFEFMREIGIAVPIRAIAMLIGFEDSDDELLARTAFQLVELTSAARTLEEMGQIQLNHEEIRLWMTDQLDRRRGGESEHLLDAVKSAIDSGQFTLNQALTTMMTLLSAGGESTSSLLGNAVRILAENPAIRRRLKADPSQIPAFIEEALRIESPFRSHIRSVPRDTALGGVAIPAGSTLMLMWGAANRDPAKFENPATINYGHKLQHVTFGRGIHLCVGAALARMEARIVLTALLEQDSFPQMSESVRPRWEYSLQVRRHVSLPMVW
ncbi:MAG: cytochrome P450 [Novosphingobium sp.]|nr:cytochrome P450 [Novosphingobium sp.]